MKKLLIISTLILSFSLALFAQKTRTVTVTTEPEATIWIDEVKRGSTDETGKLVIKFVPSGTRKLRVRAFGFKETTQNLLPTQSQVKINLVKTTDQGELTFHEAEKMIKIDRRKAIELYQKATALNPKLAAAFVELARALGDLGDNDEGLEAIANARKARPIYPEASAVEGRLHKSNGDEEKAVASFKRAIREGKGFQPEAHTGLGLLYKGKAEEANVAGEFEDETANYNLAISELKTALVQLAGTEPVLYEFLGAIYEKTQKYKEAIGVYEEYLQLFPDTPEATTFRSYIVQVKKLMEAQ